MPNQTNISGQGQGNGNTYISGSGQGSGANPGGTMQTAITGEKFANNPAGIPDGTMTTNLSDGSSIDASKGNEMNTSGSTYNNPNAAYELTKEGLNQHIEQMLFANEATEATSSVTNTLIVDASYTGTISNGSAKHPFKTIQEAIAAANNGDIIVINPGTYVVGAALACGTKGLTFKLMGNVTITATNWTSSTSLIIIGSIPEKNVITSNTIVLTGAFTIGSEFSISHVTLTNGAMNVTGSCEIIDVYWIKTATAAGTLITSANTIYIKDSYISATGAFNFVIASAGTGLEIRDSYILGNTNAVNPILTTAAGTLDVYNSDIIGQSPTTILLRMPPATVSGASNLIANNLINGLIDGNSGYFIFDESNFYANNGIYTNLTNIIASRLIVRNVNAFISFAVIPNAHLIIDGAFTLVTAPAIIAVGVVIEGKSGINHDIITLNFTTAETLVVSDNVIIEKLKFIINMDAILGSHIFYFTFMGNNITLNNIYITCTGGLPVANKRVIFYAGIMAIHNLKFEKITCQLLPNTTPNFTNQTVLSKNNSACNYWSIDINIIGLTADYTATLWNGFLVDLRSVANSTIQNLMCNYAITLVDATNGGINLSSASNNEITFINNLSIYSSSLTRCSIIELISTNLNILLRSTNINTLVNNTVNATITIGSIATQDKFNNINFIYMQDATAVISLTDIAIQTMGIVSGTVTINNCNIDLIEARGTITISQGGDPTDHTTINHIESDNGTGTLIINAVATKIQSITKFSAIQLQACNYTTIGNINPDTSGTTTITHNQNLIGITINAITAGTVAWDLSGVTYTLTNISISNATALNLTGISRKCTNCVFTSCVIPNLTIVNGTNLTFNNCDINRTAAGVLTFDGNGYKINCTECTFGANITDIKIYSKYTTFDKCTGDSKAYSFNTTGFYGAMSGFTAPAQIDLATNLLVVNYLAGLKLMFDPAGFAPEIKQVISNPGNAIVLDSAPTNAPAGGDTWQTGDEVGLAAATSTVNTLDVVGTPWLTNQWNNYRVRIIIGTGAGQEAIVGSNTGNTLNFQTAMAVAPDATSQFIIFKQAEHVEILNQHFDNSAVAFVSSYLYGLDNKYENCYFNKPFTLIGNYCTFARCTFIGNITLDVAKLVNYVTISLCRLIGDLVQSAAVPGYTHFRFLNNDMTGTVTLPDGPADSDCYGNFITGLGASNFNAMNVTALNH